MTSCLELGLTDPKPTFNSLPSKVKVCIDLIQHIFNQYFTSIPPMKTSDDFRGYKSGLLVEKWLNISRKVREKQLFTSVMQKLF